MFEIVLFQPEIPPNTGNIIRLAVNLGARLHLVEPLGFRLNDRTLARAGMDYRERAVVSRHASWAACLAALPGRRVLAFTTRGTLRYDRADYRAGDILLFGPETRGLPEEILDGLPDDCRLRVPMRPDSRSLNLANAVAVVTYEAWRQLGFAGSG